MTLEKFVRSHILRNLCWTHVHLVLDNANYHLNMFRIWPECVAYIMKWIYRNCCVWGKFAIYCQLLVAGRDELHQNKPTSLNFVFAKILHLHVRNLHNGEREITQTNERTNKQKQICHIHLNLRFTIII